MHREIRLLDRWLEEYSNEAHLSAVIAAIQYSETLPDTNPQYQDDFSPDFEGKHDDSDSLLQNPTKVPIILKDFVRALPHCPIIQWASQMCNNLKLCFCASSSFQTIEEKNKIFIHDDHECKLTAMTFLELLKYLKK